MRYPPVITRESPPDGHISAFPSLAAAIGRIKIHTERITRPQLSCINARWFFTGADRCDQPDLCLLPSGGAINVRAHNLSTYITSAHVIDAYSRCEAITRRRPNIPARFIEAARREFIR